MGRGPSTAAIVASARGKVSTRVWRSVRRPHLGCELLANLDASTLERFYATLLTGGGEGGRPLSAKTVANIAGVSSNRTGRRRAAQADPAQRLEGRPPAAPPWEMSAWTETEAATFLSSVAHERLFPRWRLALSTGMRPGELAGSGGATSTCRPER